MMFRAQKSSHHISHYLALFRVRHRIKMIEHFTTATVCDDLDRYYEALDKALLRYHGIKIGDINKIIRELWALTYKGEDITNIEIQSGQDSSSRANRSYNYRIVMFKGNSQMDMRGRCSAVSDLSEVSYTT